MKYLLCFLLLAVALSVVSAGYIGHGWNYPSSYGWYGGHGGYRGYGYRRYGGYGGWGGYGGYGGWW